MRDEISPTASGRRREQFPTASCYYTWQQKWRAQPSSAAIQLGRMKLTQQSLPQQYRDLASVHLTRSSNTKSREFWLAIQCIHHFIFLCIHHSIHIHTTWIHIRYLSQETLQNPTKSARIPCGNRKASVRLSTELQYYFRGVSPISAE